VSPRQLILRDIRERDSRASNAGGVGYSRIIYAFLSEKGDTTVGSKSKLSSRKGTCEFSRGKKFLREKRYIIFFLIKRGTGQEIVGRVL